MGNSQERLSENNDEAGITSGREPVPGIIKQALRVVGEYEAKRRRDFVEAMNA